MSVLPQGWENRPIGEITQIIAGGTPPSKDPANFQEKGGIPWLTPADLSGYRDMYISRGTRNLSEIGYKASSARKMPAGTVLFSSRAPIGYVAIAKNEISTNQGFKSFVLPDVLESHYVYYYLRHIKPLAESVATGTTFKELSGSVAAKLPLLIAPLAEQKRIADKLDTVLARVDTCRERLNRVPVALKRFRQSVLAAATMGKLTEDWRTKAPEVNAAKLLHELLKKDHEDVGGHARGNASEPTEDAHTLSDDELPDGWVVAVLRDICIPGRPITYGILKPGPELEDGIRYIRVADFPGNKLKMEGIKKTSPEIDEQFRRARLIPGDLLLSIRGSVGRLIKIPLELDGANITQDTARLSISNRVSVDFIYFALLSEAVQTRMKNATRGVAVRGINIGDVRAIQIPLASLEEQHEIVRRVETLFAFADRLEARLAIARTSTDRLTPALLAKAFRGELVPQDPNDEPASVLLARISAMPLTKTKKSKASAAKQRVKDHGIKEKKNMAKSRQDIEVKNQAYLAEQLRQLGGSANVEALFKAADLPITDFYKQLAWEVENGHIRDAKSVLEAA